MDRKPPRTFEQELAAVIPGRRVPITDDPNGPAVTVYPVAFRQLRVFTEAVHRILFEVISALPPGFFEATPGATTPGVERPGVGAPESARNLVLDRAVYASLAQGLSRAILGELLDMAAACVKPSLDGVPHWRVADVMVAWIDESFGEERKLRPWVAAMETLLEKVTGEKWNLWEPLSRLSQQLGTDSLKSSIVASLGGPTAGGASPSSDTTRSTQSGPGESGADTSSKT